MAVVLEHVTLIPAYQNHKKGERFVETTFLFELDELVGLEVSECICTSKMTNPNGRVSCHTNTTPADRKFYLCYSKAEI